MNWKQKAFIQRALSHTPYGTWLNQLLQRMNVRSEAMADSTFLFRARLAIAQLDTAVQMLGCSSDAISVFEFGAGASLVGPLTMRGRGVAKQTVVDLDPLLQPRLVMDALARLRRHRSALEIAELEHVETRSTVATIRLLRERFGIDYRAPMDARSTGLESGSFDMICSNSTMEHIPADDLDALMLECKRLLAPGGVMCFRIDYEDHYAIGDPSLSPYNFLRYTEQEWRPYNNRLHFQNRLRHSDYVALFARTGLDVVSSHALAPSQDVLAGLVAMPLAEHFRRYEIDDLAARKGTFVLSRGSS